MFLLGFLSFYIVYFRHVSLLRFHLYFLLHYDHLFINITLNLVTSVRQKKREEKVHDAVIVRSHRQLRCRFSPTYIMEQEYV